MQGACRPLHPLPPQQPSPKPGSRVRRIGISPCRMVRQPLKNKDGFHLRRTLRLSSCPSSLDHAPGLHPTRLTPKPASPTGSPVEASHKKSQAAPSALNLHPLNPPQPFRFVLASATSAAWQCFDEKPRRVCEAPGNRPSRPCFRKSWMWGVMDRGTREVTHRQTPALCKSRYPHRRGVTEPELRPCLQGGNDGVGVDHVSHKEKELPNGPVRSIVRPWTAFFSHPDRQPRASDAGAARLCGRCHPAICPQSATIRTRGRSTPKP